MGYKVGDYTVVEKINSSETADIFKAYDSNNNPVAIKIFTPSTDIKSVKNQIRQNIVYHRNLVDLYAAGVFNEREYFVAQFIDGMTITDRITTRGVYKELYALKIILQIASALEYMESLNVIHGNINPDHIMITTDGKPMLLYIAPYEENASQKSDIVDLGITFYYMLTGFLPSDYNQVPHIQQKNAQISDQTCHIVDAMMQKNNTYQYVSQVIKDLKRSVFRVERPSTPKRELQLFIPSQNDVVLSQIAIHNKLVLLSQIEVSLDRQESLYLMGVKLNISEVMVEQCMITYQQKNLLDKAKLQFLLNRFATYFFPICATKNLLSKQQIDKAKKHKNNLVSWLLSQKEMAENIQKEIYAYMKYYINNEEGKVILKVLLQNRVLNQSESEKISRMYLNAIEMAKYCCLGQFLIEKNFLCEEEFKKLLRSVRRSAITGQEVIWSPFQKIR